MKTTTKTTVRNSKKLNIWHWVAIQCS